jgi:uncharacterized membrane protein YfcA
VTILFLLIVGLGVGLTSSFLGAGGGVLVVPLLPHFMDISLKSVVATAQATVLFIVLFNTVSFRRSVKVPLKLTLLLSIGTASGAFVAARLNVASGDRTVALATISLLLFLSFLMFLQATGVIKKGPHVAQDFPGSEKLIYFTAVAMVAGASGGSRVLGLA